MELNYDLIRDLLIYIEEHGYRTKLICSIDIKGYSKEEINYHFIILNESEYIKDSRLTK